MEYEKCYVFEPDDSRPAKRRRTEPQGLQASWNLRKKAYQQAWESQHSRIVDKLETINATTVTDIVKFLDETIGTSSDGKIPTGLILAGPNSALRTSIASQVASHSTSDARRIYVSISSNAGSNLKGLLKTIIQKATSRVADEDDDELEETSGPRKGRKLLNYDLEALREHVGERRIERVVIAFEDTEAFDSDLLSELIELLGCWQDRIPFACLLNIATSVEFLQQRLSRGAVKCLEGKLFDAALSMEEVEQVFEALTHSDSTVWLGSGLMSMILERQADYVQSIESLVQAVQYAYMSCYYANALSVFLDPNLHVEDVPEDHFEALRNLDSFRTFARKLLDGGNTQQLRELLDSNSSLFEFALESVKYGRQVIADSIAATDVVRTIQQSLPGTQVSAKSSLYIQAMSGKLASSPMVRSLLLALRKAPSNVAVEVMRTVSRLDISDQAKKTLAETVRALEDLIAAQEDSTKPLRSEDDVKNSTLRTTVIAQKVELSKQKSTLSKQDAAYTSIVRRFSDLVEGNLLAKLIGAQDLVLNEIFVYDLKSPYREVFMPRPRHAVERALAAPHDYLDCDCCGPEQGGEDKATLASSQPATAVLYQLYLESGNLINASDLWQAFQAVTGAEEDEQRGMALFQRALAELRYLGFLKSTRKRVDHVAKVAWKGL
ncbi:Origin recognition complex subunit 3 [Lecanosticta acicola]|uniref:Origin recognition complex subunit 3 n=1 Tax=Lecanosticta acicola TaxID=111012 RepID=A0AAI8Z6P8_9PEZI|nr:Origin recognition complex subunit 3 [Lecanosticta acicola]